ncbi:phosphonate ABC transporter, permease protein PhnE [Methylopila sp. Yamaguchi]|uniref:phosphonate ABC transporter, permease protein PhnE n=1 Tax=Methylopila sp. Yamaguchi TaxID=1437817 RepID=UPI000CB5DBA4|nr:phosphonate ABC transporter, permease protein PhnE [Methylopila sp. Yamaguchi]GBD48156.1 phosphonate transport system permease htxC phnE [Methylopila sp. Yamaguchi]
MPSDRGRALGRLLAAALAIAALALMWRVAEVDLSRLWQGLPRLAAWGARAWPPNFEDGATLLRRAGETLAMATLGTLLGALVAAPLCLLAARTTAPGAIVYAPARALLNMLRGVDSFVFALLFVAAVGLGPFAGLLGIAMHSAGSIAKLWSETIEQAAPGPVEAATLTGASRLKVALHALLPDVAPGLTSTALYILEFNVRASTVLGVVGAGGLGQELKNAVDLLDSPRVFAIILVILVMVTAIDAFSALARRRLA